jgi:hypothetical protein
MQEFHLFMQPGPRIRATRDAFSQNYGRLCCNMKVYPFEVQHFGEEIFLRLQVMPIQLGPTEKASLNQWTTQTVELQL